MASQINPDQSHEYFPHTSRLLLVRKKCHPFQLATCTCSAFLIVRSMCKSWVSQFTLLKYQYFSYAMLNRTGTNTGTISTCVTNPFVTNTHQGKAKTKALIPLPAVAQTYSASETGVVVERRSACFSALSSVD